jgi:hypothetical protein
MRKRVYIETTVVSYLTARPAPDAAREWRQAATQQWWRLHRPLCDSFVSELVVAEAELGDADASRRRLEAMKGIPLVLTTDEAALLAKVLVRVHALPSVAEDDALHVALAAVHHMDILLTWNCGHIANPMAMPRIHATIERAGYRPPVITTPEALLESLGELL